MAITPTLCHTILALSVATLVAAQSHGVMYHFPRWSPDGASILVSAVLDGDSELYLLFLDGTPPKKLTDNAASDEAARWVDGGRRIRFVADRRGRPETFEMGADGSAPHAVDPANNDITSTRADVRIDLRDGEGVIVAVDRVRNTRRSLTKGPWAEQGSFSPDGQRIVFEQRTSGDPHRVELSNVVVARADGSEPAIVTGGTDPSWSPDGTRLLFKVWDGAVQKLFVTTARPDGRDVRRLGEGVHPQWSPDGKQIVFMRDVGDDVHIWLMAHDGRDQRCLTCGATQ